MLIKMSYAKQMNVYRIKISQRIGNDIFMEQVNQCIQPQTYDRYLDFMYIVPVFK